MKTLETNERAAFTIGEHKYYAKKQGNDLYISALVNGKNQPLLILFDGQKAKKNPDAVFDIYKKCARELDTHFYEYDALIKFALSH